MKIKRLKLKNISAIFSTLDLKTIEIDFTKMIHEILLFIGTNGSCKTYIMSQLHPFAFVGNVDVRNGQDMFIEGEDGLKEIEYLTDNGDEYLIRHHYIYQKKGRKVHSYIEKNGIELNTSGLVGTFNEIVELEFGIDIGFLKVLRLGSNVANLVGMKAADRKDFGVKLLTEVEEYVHYEKISSENYRNKKAALKVIIDKIKRLNIEDEILYQNDVDRLQKQIDDTVRNKEDMIRSFSRFEGEVESSISSTIDELTNEIHKIELSKNDCELNIADINSKLGKLSDYVYYGTIEELIEQFKESKNKNENNLSATNMKIEMISKSLNDLKNEAIDLDNKIKSYQVLNDIENIEKDLDFAYKFRDTYSKYYKGFKPTCTKTDLMEDIALMQTVGSMILSAREFSDKARKMYMKFYHDGNNIRGACVNSLVKLSTELSLCTNDSMPESIATNSAPAECKLKDICQCYNSTRKVDGSRTMKEIEDDIDIVQQCIKVTECIDNISIVLSSRPKKFPYTVKMEYVVVDVLDGTSTFFNFEEVGNMVKFLEKYEEYLSNESNIEKYEREIEYQKKQQESLDGSIVSRRKKVMIEISDYEKELIHAKKKRKKYTEEVELNSSAIEELTVYAELNSSKIKALDDLSSYQKDYEGIIGKKAMLDKYNKAKVSFDFSIKELERILDTLAREIYNKKVTLSEFRHLQEEKESLEEGFEKTALIQRAVSTKTGIPLLFMNVHLSKARVIANKIIESVYGDHIKLGKFVINEKEFRIPYYKNGTLIEDVILASQGEVSVISLAISFALIEEFSGAFGYNILLLDEVDGPLDRGNKEKFLRVLEHQMNHIGCKQVFMITHNQLFETYPVDVFVTLDKDNSIETYKNVNLIN